MNKKTIGKVAALALACASVVPTFGVVASADVAVNAETSTISGTAYLVKWQIDKVTKKVKADYNATTNTLTFNENYDYVADYAVGLDNYAGNKEVYYATSNQATSVLNGISAAVKAENANGTDGSVKYNEWKTSWTNYRADTDKYNSAIAVMKTREAAAEAAGTTEVEAYTYVDSNGYTKTIASSKVENPHTAPSAIIDTIVIYSLTSSNETKTMAQLVDELGSTVKITDGVIDKGDKYTINKTGSSTSTGTTTGTTGSYVPSSAYRYATNTVYQSNVTGLYYPNYNALYSVEGNVAYTTRAPYTYYSATYCYFDANDGTYRSTNLDDYTYYVSSSTTTTSKAIYKVNGYYYATYSDAYSAASGDTSKITYVEDYTTSYDYFSNVTGKFYSTYYAALVASNGNSSRVDVFNGASTDYYNYYDPYYYYYLNGYSYNYNTNSSSSNSGTATMGKKTGWTSIAKSLSSTNAGSTVTVSMNDEETIPSTVLSAIKGRNVTVKFTLDNGVVYTVNGKDVTTAKDVDINTTYNTKNVPSKLAKAAVKKNDGVSSAQISIDSSSLGFTSDVTIKLPSKRAGYSAKLYRYNSSRNSLVLVDTATIKTNGKCTFENVTKGGDYVVVVY